MDSSDCKPAEKIPLTVQEDREILNPAFEYTKAVDSGAGSCKSMGKCKKYCFALKGAFLCFLIFAAFRMFRPPPPFGMEFDHHGRFGPPPPPELLQTDQAMSSLVGSSLAEYYASKPAYAPGTICLACISNETANILLTLKSQLATYCTSKDALPAFCSFNAAFPDITPLVAMKKSNVDPIALAACTCASAGVCLPPVNQSGDAANFNSIQQLQSVLPPFGGGFMLHAFGHSHPPGPPSDKACSDCIAVRLNESLGIMATHFALACEDPHAHAPPPVRAWCDFGAQYPFLAKTTVLMAMHPWDFAIKSCIARGPCLPPRPHGCHNNPHHDRHHDRHHGRHHGPHDEFWHRVHSDEKDAEMEQGPKLPFLPAHCEGRPPHGHLPMPGGFMCAALGVFCPPPVATNSPFYEIASQTPAVSSKAVQEP